MWHTLRTLRLGLEAGFDHVERSHYNTVNRKILRREQYHKLDSAVNVEPMPAATTLAWNGSIVADGRREKRRGETEKRKWQLIRFLYSGISYNRFTDHKLQYLEFLVRRGRISIVRRSIIPRVGRSCGGLLTM